MCVCLGAQWTNISDGSVQTCFYRTPCVGVPLHEIKTAVAAAASLAAPRTAGRASPSNTRPAIVSRHLCGPVTMVPARGSRIQTLVSMETDER